MQSWALVMGRSLGTSSHPSHWHPGVLGSSGTPKAWQCPSGCPCWARALLWVEADLHAGLWVAAHRAGVGVILLK